MSRRPFPCRFLLPVLIGALLAPSASRVGTINVRSAADGDPANDADITLREALLIASGARTLWNSTDPNELTTPGPMGTVD